MKITDINLNEDGKKYKNNLGEIFEVRNNKLRLATAYDCCGLWNYKEPIDKMYFPKGIKKMEFEEVEED